MPTLPELYPFQSHFIEIDGSRLHYIDESRGAGEKPVLVMVHGNPTWSFYWRELVKEFRQDYRVIALDHVGCGYSDKPQDYSYRLAEHIKNLTTLIEHLNLKHITLFLHDWGGAIGMGYAVKHPRNVKGFALFNTAAFRSTHMPLRIGVCRVPVLGKILVQGFNGFAKAAMFMATHKGLSQDVKKGYLAPYNSFNNRIATYKFVQDIPMDASHPSWAVLKDIEAGLVDLQGHPMVLCWGGKDWCFNQSFLKTWQEKFPQAQTHLFEDAGHYVVEDAREKIIPIVSKFLHEVMA